MLKINWKAELPPLVMIGFMAVIAIIAYPHLPDRLPIHWNIKGEADGYWPKNPFSTMFMPLLALGMRALFLVLPNVDPKKEKYTLFAREYSIIRTSTIAFVLYIHIVMIVNSAGYHFPVEKAVPGGVALLFIVLGNLMGKMRQNFFVGFKLPWTLVNEDIWNKTHRMGGRLMAGAGIITLFGVLLPPKWTMAMLLGPLFIAIGITTVYSYLIYMKKITDITHHSGGGEEEVER